MNYKERSILIPKIATRCRFSAAIVKLKFIIFCEKSRQNERSSALCSLDVNKVSRNFMEIILVSKIRLLILCVIIKTPSSVQNCHEVNQSCTLPIGRGVSTKIVHINAINHFSFRSLIVKMVLDTIGHILGH